MSDPGTPPGDWRLRKDDGIVFGPATLDELRAWAAQGRIAPDDAASLDGGPWRPAPDIRELAMDWLVESAEGEPYGPVHVRALLDLAADGSLPGSLRVRNARDGRRLTMRALAAAEGVPLPARQPPDPGSAPADPAPPEAASVPPSWSSMARERDRFEHESARWKARYETELAAAEETIRSLREELQQRRKDLEELRSELDRHRVEAEQVRRRLSPAPSPSGGREPDGGFDAAFFEMSRCYEALAEQLADKTEELASARESLARVRDANTRRLAYLEEQVEQERRESQEARRRQARAEEGYQQIVQSLRELNFHFIRWKEAQPGRGAPPEPAPAAPPGGGRADGSPPSGDAGPKPRIRLTR